MTLMNDYPTIPLPDLGTPINLKQVTDQFQRQLIDAVLQHHQGNQAAAASHLGIHRSNFYRLLQRHGMK